MSKSIVVHVARLAPLALALTAGGCDHLVTFQPPVATVTTRMGVSNELDILFVIDNSASTLDKQTVFAANLPRFVAGLDAFPAGRPSLHVGVVSTTVDIGVSGFEAGSGAGCPHPDPADDGLLQNTARVAGCSPPTGRYLSDVVNPDGTRATNFSGDLPTALSCIGLLGSTGCGFEAPLEAMKRALDGSRPENAGFLRPQADLAVVILTDEDDCSVADSTLFGESAEDSGPGDFRCQPLAALDCDQPISATSPGTYTSCRPTHGGFLYDPSTYVDFLATIKDPSQTSVAVIGGDPSTTVATGPLTLSGSTQTLALLPSCTATINGNPAIARPGDRLAEFEQNFHDHGNYESACQSDYSNSLTNIASTMFLMMGPCLDGNISSFDVDATNPGLQPPCTVIDRTGIGTPSEVDAPIPACAMADATLPQPAGVRPCWWVEQSSTVCAASPTDLELHVERSLAPPIGDIVDATCQTP